MLSVYSTVHTAAVIERSSLKTFYIILYHGGKYCTARFAQVGIFFHIQFNCLIHFIDKKVGNQKTKPIIVTEGLT